MALPKFVLLKSDVNSKFLCYCNEKGSNHALLQFSYEEKTIDEKTDLLELKKKAEDNANSSDETNKFPYTKFEVEKAKTVEGLVHIRTCYNNKYWVRKSEDDNSIVAEANEPEEDQSKWSCTLFKPVFVDDQPEDEFISHDTPRKIQLIHVDKFGECYLGTSKTRGVDHEFDLIAGNPQSYESSDSGLVFTITDADEPKLPEFLTFMGHNGKYLATTTNRGTTYLQFKASDVGTTGVAQWTLDEETQPIGHLPFLNVDKSYYSWCIDSGKFVYLNPTGINGGFRPMKVGNKIAFHCKHNNKFLKCGGGRDMDHVLGASGDNITDDALFTIGEPIVLREIIDATYNLDDSRIYNTSNINKYVDSRSNNTSVEQSGTFEVEYKTSQTMSWTNSLTVSTSVAVSWSKGIPFVGDLGVDISYDRSETWEWGEEKTDEKTVRFTQNLTLPPKKKITLKVVALKAFCDVPFTCKVHDVLTNGTTREYTRYDGLFTGCNEFQFETLIDEEDL